MSKKAAETLVKTPTEVKICNMNFTADLDGSDEVTSIDAYAISPTGLTVVDTAYDTGNAQLRFSGGTNNVLYGVTCSVNTTNSQVFEGYGEILVRDPG